MKIFTATDAHRRSPLRNNSSRDRQGAFSRDALYANSSRDREREKL
jgi:hypothetical protein